MILWTVQPLEVYEQLKKTGVYRCEPSHSGVDKDFISAYKWLVDKMEKQIGKRPDGVKLPVWAWYIRDWKHKKPDLRLSEYGRHGEKMVLFEIEISDKAVVLSDYNAWHFVLNKWYLGNSTNEEGWDAEQRWLGSLSPKNRKVEIIKSWDNVFDIRPLDNEFVQRGRYVQATFWELKINNIRKIQFFTAR